MLPKPTRAARSPRPNGRTRASAWFEASSLALLLLESLDPERALARVDGPCLPRLFERGRLRVSLGQERLPAIEATVAAVDERTGRIELALIDVRLLPLGSALARYACERSRENTHERRAYREDVQDERGRASALRFLVESAALGTVDTPDGKSELRALYFDADSHELTWRVRGPVPEAPFLIAAQGYNSVYRIPVQTCRLEGERLTIARAPWLEVIRSRRALRVEVDERLRVTFDHPLWPTLRVQRELLDLTRHGLSFSAIEEDESVYPGLAIPRLFVETRSGEAICLRASVRSARGSDAASFGCEVSPESDADAARWLTLCDEQLFPRTRRGAAEVWSVYTSSGYFGLSETLEGEFDHLKAAYVNATRALSRAPELGCQSTWPSVGSPKATVTNLRLTPSCWFSYHLAAQPDETMTARSADVLRDLYRQYIEHSLATPGPRWQMAYVQHSAHWSMRVHVEIPRRYLARNEAWVQDFRAIEVRTVGHAARPHESLLFQRASAAERATALCELERKLSPIYFDALDYAPERFALEEFKLEWARHGLERDRDLLIAHDGDVPVALGVVECAEPGLHLFGLLDTLRLYSCSERGERAFSGLIDLARTWFRERGRRSFCYLEEEGQVHADGRQIKHMSSAYLTLLSVERLPEMLEQLYADTARS